MPTIEKEKVYHFKKENIKYLAFEGGGGKGVAFLGAIAALEKLGVIKNVQGIAGTSAGAITAFLLALGYDTMGIAKALSNTETFIGFYDGPSIGKTRGVIENEYNKTTSAKFLNDDTDWRLELFEKGITNGYFEKVSDAVDSFPDHFLVNWIAFSGLVMGGALGMAGAGMDNTAGSKAAFFGSGFFTSLYLLGAVTPKIIVPYVVKSKVMELGKKEDPDTNKDVDTPYKDLVDKIAPDIDTFKTYIKNVLLDRGLFPGFALRNFFRDRLLEKYEKVGDNTFNPSFADFCTDENNIELRVVSVNSTTHRPQIFSQKKTPHFPVIDAVGMSSSFPFAFKPVLVWGCQTESDDGEKTGPPNGYYLDGGLLVNLPMHLFDEATDGKLNENMLAIRVETLHPEEEKEDKNYDDKGAFDILSNYAGDLMNTALFPSEEGQIRNEAERHQTIALDVTGLETLQFVAPIEKSGPKIIEAYIKTMFTLNQTFMKDDPIFNPAEHYYSGEKKENKEDGYYKFSSKEETFETALGISKDDKNKKGKMVLKIIENIMDDTPVNGLFSSMLQKLKWTKEEDEDKDK